MKTLCAASLTFALAVGFVACGGGGASGPDAGPQAGADAQVLHDGCSCIAPTPDAEATGLDAAVAPAPDAEAQPGLDAAGPPGLDAATPPGLDAAGNPGPDAGGTAAGADAFVPLDYDAGPKPCVFNTDCPPNEYCDDPAFVCMIGPRGNGKTGVDVCTNGNSCEGAMCTEGWPTGTYYCSGPCGGDAGTCGGQLTVCMFLSFLDVWTCVRNKDGGM